MIMARGFIVRLGRHRALAAGAVQRLEVLQSMFVQELEKAKTALEHTDRVIRNAHEGLDPSIVRAARPGLRAGNKHGVAERRRDVILKTLQEHAGEPCSAEEISWALIIHLGLDFADINAKERWQRGVVTRQLTAMALVGLIIEERTSILGISQKWWSVCRTTVTR